MKLPPPLAWERPSEEFKNRPDIIAQREIVPGVLELLMHNEGLYCPYYTALGFTKDCPEDVKSEALEANLHRGDS